MLCLQKCILSSTVQQQNIAALAKKEQELSRALAAGSAAESDDRDTQVADRVTLHINLWAKDSWSDCCASCARNLFQMLS